MKKSVIFAALVCALLCTSCSKKGNNYNDLNLKYETALMFSGFTCSGLDATAKDLIDDEVETFLEEYTRTYDASGSYDSLEDAYAAADAAMATKLAQDWQAAEDFYNDLKARFATGTGFGDYAFEVRQIVLTQERDGSNLKQASKDNLSYTPAK